MDGEWIELDLPDGRADGLVFRPAGDGPWPLVVSYMDAAGLRPGMAAMARRLADAGYAVVQPNLFWRSGPYRPFDTTTVFVDPPERARLMALVTAVRSEQVLADTRAFVAAVGADPRVHAERIGVVGYCMGGRLAFVAAAGLPDLVAAAAAVHAGRIVTDAPDSPHLGAPRVRGRLYFAVAVADPSCTAADVDKLRTALEAAGTRHAIELYPGALHGFAVPDFPTYDATAAERHWERVLALFADEL